MNRPGSDRAQPRIWISDPHAPPFAQTDKMQSFDPNGADQGVGLAIEDRRGRRPELVASAASPRLRFLVQALGGEAGRQGERRTQRANASAISAEWPGRALGRASAPHARSDI